ncbi:HAMP domain-containing sensor histidine kinase [Paenibacillus odorifer]|uniref:HAMP domain-containing sensor histidine kinase n=1 Tax=Paenibacillus odorifer TaxID=189426 RepID=UPI00096D92D5|nr:HAMP domain-containing sensor histidine kinase [Paenibacillus odorifer]OMD61922.1 two-component sensor histidine kinase [Paenibacillus odorifer]
MTKKLLLALLLTIFAASLALTFLILNLQVETGTDRVAINTIVKLTEQNWDKLDPKLYKESPYEFAIIDTTGVLKYQTGNAISVTVNEAINNRDTLVDVFVQDKMVGKVIINNDYRAIFIHMKKQFIQVSIVMLLLLTVLGVLYIWFLNRSVLRPFRKMQLFAKHIARGDLEVPLEMDRNHLFGAFTESFDMMREELAAARHSEYLANKSKKELVASLSHDIKTPVASLKAITELMLLSARDEKTGRQLNTLYSKADQIDRLVTDMFHSTLEELNELKVSLMEEQSHLLIQIINNVNFYERISAASVPDCIITVDPLRLQQVIDNVVNNSYKYAHTDTPIDIKFEITDHYLEVDILDYGPGVPEEELPLVFNKFFRGSLAVSQNGAGLGLYISRYMMQKMQGDIVCSNREDGFTVKLLIPLAGQN